VERFRIAAEHELLVDKTDAEFVSTLGLSVVIRGDLKHVAINTQPYYKQYLHRVLLGVIDSNHIVDHKNGNGLDNRRANLRVTTKVGNALNMKVNSNKKSGLPKGVYKERDGYRACVQINGLNRYLGHFTSIDKAEAKYKQVVQTYWDSSTNDGKENWSEAE
jgi:hypothetical protein